MKKWQRLCLIGVISCGLICCYCDFYWICSVWLLHVFFPAVICCYSTSTHIGFSVCSVCHFSAYFFTVAFFRFLYFSHSRACCIFCSFSTALEFLFSVFHVPAILSFVDINIRNLSTDPYRYHFHKVVVVKFDWSYIGLLSIFIVCWFGKLLINVIK